MCGEVGVKGFAFAEDRSSSTFSAESQTCGIRLGFGIPDAVVFDASK